MSWIDSFLDRTVDYVERRRADGVDTYGSDQDGYFIEYGSRVRSFDEAEGLISFYNRKLKPYLNLEDVTTIGSAPERARKKMERSDHSAVATSEGDWMVDVYSTVRNSFDTAFSIAAKESAGALLIDPEDPPEVHERQLEAYYDKLDQNPEDFDERVEQAFTDILSATTTQAVVAAETESFSREGYSNEVVLGYLTGLIENQRS